MTFNFSQTIQPSVEFSKNISSSTSPRFTIPAAMSQYDMTMRRLALSSLPIGYFDVNSCCVLASNWLWNHARACRIRDSRRNSYRLKRRFACSCVTCPIRISPPELASRFRLFQQIIQRFAPNYFHTLHPTPADMFFIKAVLNPAPQLPRGVILPAGNRAQLHPQ